jgi:hypothetical protein
MNWEQKDLPLNECLEKSNVKNTERRSGHATGMAGEYFVMERLFRLGHEPALTLGNAKSIDILVQTKSGRIKKISVKAACGGGKWGVDKRDLSEEKDLIFVLLLYRRFGDPTTDPEVWVMPAPDVEKRKSAWFLKSGIYYSHRKHAPPDLHEFRDRWDLIEKDAG